MFRNPELNPGDIKAIVRKAFVSGVLEPFRLTRPIATLHEETVSIDRPMLDFSTIRYVKLKWRQ